MEFKHWLLVADFLDQAIVIAFLSCWPNCVLQLHVNIFGRGAYHVSRLAIYWLENPMTRKQKNFLEIWQTQKTIDHAALNSPENKKMVKIDDYNATHVSELREDLFALPHGPCCLKMRRLNWRTTSRQKMQHSVAPWLSLIRSVRKVRPPFHCSLSLKTSSKNHFCCQQARCRIDSLQAITVLGEPS